MPSSEIKKLRLDFEKHVKEETIQWESISAGMARIEGVLSSIEINGSGQTYTLQEAFHYIAELLRSQRRRFAFTRKWGPRLEAGIEWLFTSRIGRLLLLFLLTYFISSLLEDAGLVRENALKFAWRIASHWGE